VKFSYAEHVTRADSDRWAKAIMEWCPYDGRRSRERPITRWRDEIQGRAGKVWHRVGQNRSIWQKLGKAYAWL